MLKIIDDFKRCSFKNKHPFSVSTTYHLRTNYTKPIHWAFAQSYNLQDKSNQQFKPSTRQFQATG